MASHEQKKGKWRGLRFKSTWTDYRYGTNRKKVSLPQVFAGKSRESAIDGLFLDMKDWRLSPFEKEGECRAGVRQALCLKGHEWAVADITAESLVQECLSRMGAKRPNWEEGQPHYSVPRENCARCGCSIDEEDQAQGFRYCSEMCAIAYRQHLSDQVPWDHVLRRAGYWQIIISQAPVKRCPTCDKSFKSREKTAVYCSLSCNPVLQRVLEDRSCQWCGGLFRPKDDNRKFCSHPCAIAHRVHVWKTEAPIISCARCHTQFRATSGKSMYCSDRCFKDVKNERRRATEFKSYPMECTVCSVAYIASKRHSVVCSPECYKVRQRDKAKLKQVTLPSCEEISIRSSNIIYLTPEIFDDWIRRAA